MKDPVDHIERPRLPWRSADEPSITECGLNSVKVKTLTRSEYFRRLKEFGQQRTALMTCMTCADTAKRWKTWEECPRGAVQREIEWEGIGYYRSFRTDRGTRMLDELRAIALLIERYPEDFARLLHDVRNTIDLKAEREKRARQPRQSSGPKWTPLK